MEITPPKKIKVTNVAGKGRGIIATEHIKKGEIIEYCPIVFLHDKEAEFFEADDTPLSFYYLTQTAFNKHTFMLGYGALYNHSKDPNADIDYDTKDLQNYIIFEAIWKEGFPS